MNNRKKIAFVVIAILFLLSLSSCASNDISQHIWLHSEGWGRGKLIGVTGSTNPTTFEVDQNGNQYFLLTTLDESPRLRLISWNDQTDLNWDVTLVDEYSSIFDPKLIMNDNELKLFWITKKALYFTSTDLSGNIKSSPEIISGDYVVNSYDVVENDDDTISIWFSGDRYDPGVYYLENVDSNPEVVNQTSIRCSVQYDDKGVLNVFWLEYPRGFNDPAIFFTQYISGQYSPDVAPHEVIRLNISPSSVLSGPWMAMEDEEIYILWGIEIRTGMSAGITTTSFVTFHKNNPDSVTSEQILRTPLEYELPYEIMDNGYYAVGERFDMNNAKEYSNTHIRGMYPNDETDPETLIALQVQTKYLYRKERSQIGVMYFNDGLPISYQLISFTSSSSDAPFVMSDNGEVYLTWHEKSGEQGFPVYFATTNQDMQSIFKELQTEDYLSLAKETIFGILSGFVLFPFAAAIMGVAPILWVAISGKLRTGSNPVVVKIMTVTTLLIGVGLFWGTKLALLPQLMDVIPFSFWIPGIPDGTGLLLKYLVPVIILLVSLYFSWSLTYKDRSQSAIYFILIYIAIDAAITMSIYGTLIYNGG